MGIISCGAAAYYTGLSEFSTQIDTPNLLNSEIFEKFIIYIIYPYRYYPFSNQDKEAKGIFILYQIKNFGNNANKLINDALIVT